VPLLVVPDDRSAHRGDGFDESGLGIPEKSVDRRVLDDSKLSQEIRRGFKLFTNTPAEAPRLAPAACRARTAT
jgi:hypothetical protein